MGHGRDKSTLDEEGSFIGMGITKFQQVHEMVHAKEGRLQKLCLHGNRLSNLRGVENLKGLVDLDLSSNCLTDISALRALKRLRTLELSSNRIRNLDGLGHLDSLQELRLAHNLIEGLKEFSHGKLRMTLKVLDLRNNRLQGQEQLVHLSGFHQLKTFRLRETGALDGNDVGPEHSLINFLHRILPDLHYLDGKVIPRSFSSFIDDREAASERVAAPHHESSSKNGQMFGPVDRMEQAERSSKEASPGHPDSSTRCQTRAMQEEQESMFRQLSPELSVSWSEDQINFENCKPENLTAMIATTDEHNKDGQIFNRSCVDQGKASKIVAVRNKGKTGQELVQHNDTRSIQTGQTSCCSNSRQKIHKLRKRMDEEKEERLRAQRKVELQAEQIERTKLLLHDEIEKKERLQMQVEKLAGSLEELAAGTVDRTAQHLSEIKAWMEKVLHLDAQSCSLQKKVQRYRRMLERSLQRANDAIKDKERQADALVEEVDELQRRLAESENAGIQSKSQYEESKKQLESLVESYNQKVEVQSQQLYASKDALEKLKDNVDCLSRKFTPAEQFERERRTFNRLLKESEDKILQLRAEMKALKSSHSMELESERRNRSDAEERLQQCQRKLAALESIPHGASGQNSAEKETRSFKDMKKLISGQQKLIEELQGKVEASEGTSRATASRLGRAKSRWRDILKSLGTRVSLLRREKDEALHQLQDIRHRLQGSPILEESESPESGFPRG